LAAILPRADCGNHGLRAPKFSARVQAGILAFINPLLLSYIEQRQRDSRGSKVIIDSPATFDGDPQ
jgi:hypothetical protein